MEDDEDYLAEFGYDDEDLADRLAQLASNKNTHKQRGSHISMRDRHFNKKHTERKFRGKRK